MTDEMDEFVETNLNSQEQVNILEDVCTDYEDQVSEEETWETSSQRLLEALEEAWINEKFAPEILPHKSGIVGYVLTLISHMEETMKKNLKKGDLRITIHTMELNRIRFVLSSYLRTRLEKIENYVLHILSQENEKANNNSEDLYLTPNERKFAQEYLINFESLFQTLALQHMPEVGNLNLFEVNQFSVKPNLDAHVFLKANKNISGIIVPGIMEDEVEFEEGSQHIIQYRVIAELLKRGDVQLI